MNIWERYFLKEIIRTTCMILLAFFLLYIMIDYSNRSAHWSLSNVSIAGLTSYYILIFFKNIEILLPFALLLASIKTLCALNVNHELIALLASGIPMRRLLRPFILVGLLCTGLMYLHFEAVVPRTLYRIQQFEEQTLKITRKSKSLDPIQNCTLPDGSVVLYQSCDPTQGSLFDVYWIRSFDEVMRIKYLYPYKKEPVGQFVDQFSRNQDGVLVKTHSFDSKVLSEMVFDEELLLTTLRSHDELSLSQLWDRISVQNTAMSTWFWKRMLIPWLCLLAIIAPASYCLTFTRQLRVLYIYIVALIGLISLQLMLNAGTIMAQASVLPPLIALGLPFLLCYGYFGWKFARL